MGPSVRRRVLLLVAAAVWTVGVSALRGAPTAALSCAPREGTLIELLDGSGTLASGHPLFDEFDFAFTGTVGEIRTDDVDGSPTYGATDVVFDVIDGYGTDAVASRLTVHQADPGWLSGFPYRKGGTYFVPVPYAIDDQRPVSFVCDPIFELDRSAAEALAGDVADIGRLTVVQPAAPRHVAPDAAPGVVTEVVPDASAGASATVAPPVTVDDGSGSTLLVGLGLVMLVGTIGAVVLVVRRRR